MQTSLLPRRAWPPPAARRGFLFHQIAKTKDSLLSLNARTFRPSPNGTWLLSVTARPIVLPSNRITREGFGLMTTNQRICKTCGRPTKLLLQPDGDGPRSYQCLRCDRPDPLKLPRVNKLVKGLLHEPKE